MPRGRWSGADIAAGATSQWAQPGCSLSGHRRRCPVCRGDDLLFPGHPVGRLRPRRPRDDGARRHDGPGSEDGTRSAAIQRLCRRFGGHGVDHAAEPASSRPSRPDKSGRYSRLAVRYDAGPAASAHLGQSHPDAGPLRRPRLCGAAAGRLGRGTGPRPAHGPVDEVIVGAAGALAAPDAARALGDALLASLRAERVAVTSDAVIAHAGALDGGPGVVLIAGTGVVALAIGADGALRTADGWGPWLGDEGGGAWIGAAGLRAALRAHDGRGPPTTLLAAACARFGAPETWPAQLTSAAALASFAPDVLDAEGDAAALAIVSAAAEALAAP